MANSNPNINFNNSITANFKAYLNAEIGKQQQLVNSSFACSPYTVYGALNAMALRLSTIQHNCNCYISWNEAKKLLEETGKNISLYNAEIEYVSTGCCKPHIKDSITQEELCKKCGNACWEKDKVNGTWSIKACKTNNANYNLGMADKTLLAKENKVIKCTDFRDKSKPFNTITAVVNYKAIEADLTEKQKEKLLEQFSKVLENSGVTLDEALGLKPRKTELNGFLSEWQTKAILAKIKGLGGIDKILIANNGKGSYDAPTKLLRIVQVEENGKKVFPLSNIQLLTQAYGKAIDNPKLFVNVSGKRWSKLEAHSFGSIVGYIATILLGIELGVSWDIKLADNKMKAIEETIEKYPNTIAFAARSAEAFVKQVLAIPGIR